MSELHYQALELAVRGGLCDSAAVSAASKYLTFLQGQTSGASTDAASVAKRTTQASSADTGGSTAKDSAGNAAADQKSDQSGTASTDAGAAAGASSSEVDVPALQQACTKLAGTKGKPELLAAFQSVGAGKWSEVPAEKYGALQAEIDRRLAA